MIIRKFPIHQGYTKVDNRVTTNGRISDGAFRLYAYYLGLKQGDNFVDNYIIKALKISQQTLTKRKKELRDQKLILTVRLSARIYVLYVGSSKMSAQALKLQYEAEERERIALPEGEDYGE